MGKTLNLMDTALKPHGLGFASQATAPCTKDRKFQKTQKSEPPSGDLTSSIRVFFEVYFLPTCQVPRPSKRIIPGRHIGAFLQQRPYAMGRRSLMQALGARRRRQLAWELVRLALAPASITLNPSPKLLSPNSEF